MPCYSMLQTKLHGFTDLIKKYWLKKNDIVGLHSIADNRALLSNFDDSTADALERYPVLSLALEGVKLTSIEKSYGSVKCLQHLHLQIDESR